MKRNVLCIVTLLLAACATLAVAAVSVQIREWDVPKGSFPHDPAAGPDGALWYTGMQANTLGRLDPQTGQVREYPLKPPGR